MRAWLGHEGKGGAGGFLSTAPLVRVCLVHCRNRGIVSQVSVEPKDAAHSTTDSPPGAC